MPDFLCFRLEFEKNIVIFEISTLESVLLINIAEKTEMPKFGTKKALFRYFLDGNLKKLLSYLKSARPNFSFCKISRKIKKA